jgi:hypothetical protein
MSLKRHHNYVAVYSDGFKIGRTANPARRMRELRPMAMFAGHAVSPRVALHTETHIRRVLRQFALPGTLEYFEGSKAEALEAVAFTARTQKTLEAAGV